MSLIDATFFIGELNIAQTDQIAVMENLDVFIAKYEKKFLNLLLGETLYAEFVAGLEVDPIAQKWTDLKNKLVNDGDKTSPIANYIYYHYSENNATKTTGVSEVVAVAENASYTTPIHKMMRAWNEMVLEVIDIEDWLRENIAIYPDLIDYSFRYLSYGCDSKSPEIFYLKNRFGI